MDHLACNRISLSSYSRPARAKMFVEPQQTIEQKPIGAIQLFLQPESYLLLYREITSFSCINEKLNLY